MSIQYKQIQWRQKKTILGITQIEPENPLHLLIGFHGAESTPENMLVHGNHLQLTNTVFAFPEGPINANDHVWSWWKDGPKQQESVNGFLFHMSHVISEASEWVQSEFGQKEFKISLWGFSQGAAAALVLTLLGTHPIHKVASVCGFLPELPESKETEITRTKILGIFGVNDEVVPTFLSEHALDEMKTLGHSCIIHKTSQSHEINAENLKIIQSFFMNT